MPDIARGLATLGERDEALGRDWLLPVADARTTREVAGLIGNAIGWLVQVMALPDMATVASLGVLEPTFLVEYEELFYQYTEPQIVDSSAITRELGVVATPLPEAIAATVRWYQAKVAPIELA
jgi:nucleoside-diphosphate-sugar epimerase